MPEEQTLGPFSADTINEIWKLLQTHELIQIRGVAKGDKRSVFTVASRLCLELEMLQPASDDGVTLPVALLQTKGHVATIYSPTLDLEDPNHFPLRTSVGQKNTWTAREKAPRDHRGQIIRDDSD